MSHITAFFMILSSLQSGLPLLGQSLALAKSPLQPQSSPQGLLASSPLTLGPRGIGARKTLISSSIAFLLAGCGGNKFEALGYHDAGSNGTMMEAGKPDAREDAGTVIRMDSGREGGTDSGRDSSVDAAVDSGHLLDSGMDAELNGSPPLLLRPEAGVTLSPTRAFILLEDGFVPQQLSVAGYQICHTTQGLPFINNDSLCPNPIQIIDNHTVIDSLIAGATYFIKENTFYDDSSISPYGPTSQFTTDNSLLVWLKHDAGAGTASDDSSVNNVNGVLNNFNTANAWVPGIIGSALRFDGIDDSVTLASEDNFDFGAGNFTLATWINPTNTGDFQAIIEKRSLNPDNFFEFYRKPTGMLGFSSSACAEIVAGGNLVEGVWHYVVVTRVADTFNLFINGALEATGNCVDDFNNTSPLTIGCNSPEASCSEPFSGDIDEVSIFNRALSLEEIRYHGYCATLKQGGQTLPALCLQ